MSNIGIFFISLIIVIVGFVCIAGFYIGFLEDQPTHIIVDTDPGDRGKTPVADSTPQRPVGAEIKLPDIDTVSLRTNFRGFYDSGSVCAKEPEPKILGSFTSPCMTVLTFNRDGSATKSIGTENSGKNGTKKWTANLTADQFNELLKEVAGGSDKIDWPQVEVYISNFTVTVTQKGGSIYWMGNLPEKSNVKMVDIFSREDRKINWKPV